jgi:hypothetical protein
VPFTPVPTPCIGIRNGVTDGEAGELNKGAQDTCRPSSHRCPGWPKVTLRLLADDRRIGADRAVVGLSPEVHGQVHASAVRIHIAAGARFLRRRLGHVKAGGVAHAVDMVSPQIASDLQAGVGAWDGEEARSVECADFHVLDRGSLDRKVCGSRPSHRH